MAPIKSGKKPSTPKKVSPTTKNSLKRSPKSKAISGAGRKPNKIYSVMCKQGVVVYIPVKPVYINGKDDQEKNKEVMPYIGCLFNLRGDEEAKKEIGIDFVCERRRHQQPGGKDLPMLTSTGNEYLQMVTVYEDEANMTDDSVGETGRKLASYFQEQSQENDKYPMQFRYVGHKHMTLEDGTLPAPGVLLRNQETMDIMDDFYPEEQNTPEERAENLSFEFFGDDSPAIRDLIMKGVVDF